MEFEERYFREELDYLRQLSKLLATEKPHLARFLAEKDADPDIERLLEGVAFLTGNLRQKIEDEFPELTHGLIKMLWPNYLRPVPAMTLIEYTPDMDKSSVPVLIPRNEQFTTNAGEIRVDEVLPSDAKKEEPPPCTFTLCRDIWLLPVRLEQIENRSTTRNGVINITFSVAPGTDFRTLDLNKLRFWLGNDDNYTRDQLYLWFCEYLQGADLTVGEQHIRLPEFMLKAVGFEPQDAMLPWPKNVHSGYRILQEYFCYPDAFLFFDLCGCPALPDGLQAEFFTLQLRFSRPLPVDTFYQQNLKLFIDNDLSLEDGDNNVIIREDIIAQLETAQKIRDIFFSKQNGLGTSFAVETVSLSGNKRRSVLNLDGQLVDYSQGRNYTAHLVWPNNMREGNESKLTLIGTSGNAPRSISFSGPWAQFRLFGAGQLTGVQDGNFTVRFSVDGGAMTYRVHTDTEDNPFSGGLFSQFGLSDTLY